MNKFNDTRFVTFKEDYNIKTRDGGKKTIYKKGVQYAIHVNNVKALEKRKAQMTVISPNWEELKQKRKKIYEARQKAAKLIYE